MAFSPLRFLLLATPALLATKAAAEDNDVSIMLGAGAGVVPAYEGSKQFKAVPLPLIDIRGLADDRLFVSTLRGIGVTVLNWGDLRAGVAVNVHGGRSSHDDDRLRGLPGLSTAIAASGFVTYSLKPFTFELNGQNIFGPAPGTEVTAKASWSFSPFERLKVSIGPEATWADRRYDRSYFGVTDDQAIAATAAGNPLHPYSPGSGLKDVGLSTTAAYQITDHWGVMACAGVTELVGNAARHSPLTERDTQPSAFLGLTYRF